ncbi:hypothetical protein AA23498_0275 [Acetobacter nitrogenifigens DSM 23921 = NBRC 105050]|nr:hypothetical protein AA23498_0275 [Acetobacter nitrogenifigens DSM 23921 = NBRC 105050]
MRGEAAKYGVEDAILEWKPFRRGLYRPYIRQTPADRLSVYGAQHLISDVAGCYFRHMRGQAIGDVAAATSEIQDTTPLLPLRGLLDRVEVAALAVHRASDIILSASAVMLRRV